jgi:protein-disulfide isomerase
VNSDAMPLHLLEMTSGKATKRKRAAQRSYASSVKARRRVNPAPTPTHVPAVGQRRVPRALPWLALAGALGIAIMVALVLAMSRSSETTPESSGSGPTLPDATAAVAAVRGIPQRGVVLGKPNAPVTLVEFVDLQCPFCREFTVEAMPSVIAKHVRSGKVRVEVRGLAFVGPDSERGMRAAFAAARQNRMFELIELLYYNQGPENTGWLTQDLIEAAARSVPGIDVARLVDEMDSDAVSRLLQDHANEAERRNVTATPTIFVGPTGGELEKVTLTSPSDVAPIEQAIAAAR